MDPPGTPGSQNQLEREAQHWRTHISLFQNLLPCYHHQNSMVLASRQTRDWNREPGHEPSRTGSKTLDSTAEATQRGEEDSLQPTELRKRDLYMQKQRKKEKKRKLNTYLTQKLIQEGSKPKPRTPLGGNRGQYLQDGGLGGDVLDMTPEAQATATT